jgi:nucleotide-binding universal stress UspA family protein
MFHRILVPTDFSEQSKRAMDIALAISNLYNGCVTLLHVIEIIADSTFAEFESFYTKLEDRARKNMDDWAEAAAGSGVKIEKKIIYGNRTGEIVRFAEENQVDLIVLNSHKIDVNEPTLGWGTISYKVSILSSCPVMLVK